MFNNLVWIQELTYGDFLGPWPGRIVPPPTKFRCPGPLYKLVWLYESHTYLWILEEHLSVHHSDCYEFANSITYDKFKIALAELKSDEQAFTNVVLYLESLNVY